MDASETEASHAMRGLDVIEEYAKRHNLTNAYDDRDWLANQCHGLTDAQLIEYLQEKKKGDYQ